MNSEAGVNGTDSSREKLLWFFVECFFLFGLRLCVCLHFCEQLSIPNGVRTQAARNLVVDKYIVWKLFAR